jgi:hypothetical protein
MAAMLLCRSQPDNSLCKPNAVSSCFCFNFPNLFSTLDASQDNQNRPCIRFDSELRRPLTFLDLPVVPLRLIVFQCVIALEDAAIGQKKLMLGGFDLGYNSNASAPARPGPPAVFD